MNKRKWKYIKVRGKTILVLPEVKMPSLYFHPDTPKKVVWMEPS